MLLAGCQQENTYQYFMTHPKVLQKKLTACENTAESKECAVVSRAGNDFSKLADEQLNDSDLFGQQLIKAEEQLFVFSQEYEKAKQTGNEDKIKSASQAYQDQSDLVQIYKAVLSTRSPN